MIFKPEPPEHQRTAIPRVAEVFLNAPNTTGRCVKQENGGRAERLYSSFAVPIILLWYPRSDSEMSRRYDRNPIVLSKRSHRSQTEVYAICNMCFSVHETSFEVSWTYVSFKNYEPIYKLINS